MSGQKMHANEVHTDVRLVARMVAAQFPQWASLPIEPVPSAGTDNALYRLGDDMVVRLPRISWAVDTLDLEYEWLPRLAPHLPVAIPTPLGRGRPAEGFPWPWSVYRWLDGENPAVDGLVDPGLLATELAEFIAALRRIDATDGPPASRGRPLARRDAPTRAALDALDGMIDTDAATAAWDAALKVPEWPGGPVWLHGDLAPGNLLCVQSRLSAVIDFGCLGVGDPTCDLIVAWNLLPADSRNTFRTALQVDDATWNRARGCALSIALVQLPYYWETNPVLAASARHVIREVLADAA
ncbi:MAG TPA: aminoglycoside phosphotransferase family protein [Acidimicrobiales bacterium]|jgi:aminoglycoside phosphotransferase (APT) family kinase protein